LTIAVVTRKNNWGFIVVIARVDAEAGRVARFRGPSGATGTELPREFWDRVTNTDNRRSGAG